MFIVFARRVFRPIIIIKLLIYGSQSESNANLNNGN